MKISCFIIMIFTGVIISGISSADTINISNKDVLQIRALMQQEVVSWNKGNVKEFMGFYKDSPKTLYISSKIISGYQNILNRYLTTYPTPNNMGQLSFKLLDIKLLSPQYAFVIGQWHLIRNKAGGGNIGGFFTLLLEKVSGRWKIVVDHTTVN